MDKRYLTLKTLTAVFCVLVIALFLSDLLYAYRTPKVYVIYVSQGMIAGNRYDCVVPKEALHNGNMVYIVSEKETVLGKRYRVYGETVTVEAEDNGMAAIHLGKNDDFMIVLAHDGRLKGNGDVLVYGS